MALSARGRSRPRAATIDVYGPERTVDVVSQIQAKLVAARTPGVDRGKIQRKSPNCRSTEEHADSGVQR
jgi:flagellin